MRPTQAKQPIISNPIRVDTKVKAGLASRAAAALTAIFRETPVYASCRPTWTEALDTLKAALEDRAQQAALTQEQRSTRGQDRLLENTPGQEEARHAAQRPVFAKALEILAGGPLSESESGSRDFEVIIDGQVLRAQLSHLGAGQHAQVYRLASGDSEFAVKVGAIGGNEVAAMRAIERDSQGRFPLPKLIFANANGLVMELVAGPCGSKGEQAWTKLKPGSVLDTLAELVKLHQELGLFHNDIRHDNLRLTATGELRILDWGSVATSPVGNVLGTFLPEGGTNQFNKATDRAAGDLFCLGAALATLTFPQGFTDLESLAHEYTDAAGNTEITTITDKRSIFLSQIHGLRNLLEAGLAGKQLFGHDLDPDQKILADIVLKLLHPDPTKRLALAHFLVENGHKDRAKISDGQLQYQTTDQTVYRRFTEAMASEAAQFFKTLTSSGSVLDQEGFKALLTIMGQERQKVAVQTKSDMAYAYGVLRNSINGGETFREGDAHSLWKNATPKVLTLIKTKLTSLEEGTYTNAEGFKTFVVKGSLKQNQCTVTLFDGEASGVELGSVSFDAQTPGREAVNVRHFLGHAVLDRGHILVNKALNASSDDAFKEALGELAWLLSIDQPFWRGTAAISEILFDALARARGQKLVLPSETESFPRWDIAAFTEFDKTTFATFFKDHAGLSLRRDA